MKAYQVELETSGFEDEELQEFLKQNNVAAKRVGEWKFPSYQYQSPSRLTLVRMILTFWLSGDDETDWEVIDSIKEVILNDLADDQDRLDPAIEEAVTAFWKTIAQKYPEIKSGDLSVDMTVQFGEACKTAVQEWLRANQ